MNPPLRTADENRRAGIVARMAYEVLPGRPGSKPSEFAADFRAAPEVLPLRLYTQAAREWGDQPHPEDLARVRAHFGRFGPHREFYLFEYPAFPAVNLLAPETGWDVNGGRPPESGPYVLAPYLSAVIVHQELREAVCYTLGQSPDGGTQVRAVTRDGNFHLDPGCEPTPAAFLALLRKLPRRPGE